MHCFRTGRLAMSDVTIITFWPRRSWRISLYRNAPKKAFFRTILETASLFTTPNFTCTSRSRLQTCSCIVYLSFNGCTISSLQMHEVRRMSRISSRWRYDRPRLKILVCASVSKKPGWDLNRTLDQNGAFFFVCPCDEWRDFNMFVEGDRFHVHYFTQ